MKRRRAALFCAQVVDYDGSRRRLTQAELSELWRLWCRHRAWVNRQVKAHLAAVKA